MTSPWTPTPRERLTDQERAEVFVKEGGVCHKCGRRLRAGENWVVEHFLALECGGTNHRDNLTVTCGWCKSAKDAEDHGKAAKARHVRTKHVLPSSERDKRRGFRGWRNFRGELVWRSK